MRLEPSSNVLLDLDGRFSLTDIPFMTPGDRWKDAVFLPHDYMPEVITTRGARLNIRSHLPGYKMAIVTKVDHMLAQAPPYLPGERQPYDLRPDSRIAIGNLIADAYIRAVDEFLRTRPGARPELGMRNFVLARDWVGIQNEFNRPWCADWARELTDSTLVNDNLKSTSLMALLDEVVEGKKLSCYIGIKHVQLRKWLRSQHNLILVYSKKGDPLTFPGDEGRIIMLDPWMTICPASSGTGISGCLG